MRRNFEPLPAAVVIVAVAAITLFWPRAWPTLALLAAQATLTAAGGFWILRWLRRGYGIPYPRPVPVAEVEPVIVHGPRRARAEWLAAHRNFRGRADLLARIIRFHDEARHGPSPAEGSGPLLLLLHGQAGVGKTSLAQELARRLAAQYPGGQYYANLGNAGDPRSPGEVLTALMGAVGWPDPLLPQTSERAKVFRALCAGQKMLFVLDAARDPSQILGLLPSEPECTVIVTSRRDLGARIGGRSWHVATPDIGDALDHLYSVARVGDFDNPECAVQLVDLCGRLPLAIQAAGERIAYDGMAVCDLRRILEGESQRVEQLSRRGRDLDEAVATEFDRLSGIEQRALCLLSLVESPTFAPIVLCPLLSVRIPVAEGLMTSLSDAQLLEAAGADHITGLARYRFSPLVRLFVQDYIAHDAELAAHCTEARERLAMMYRELAVRILDTSDESVALMARYDLPDRPSWLPVGWRPDDAAKRLAPWVRSDYRNLMRCALDAYEQRDWALCWRVVAWLGECLPHGPLEALDELFTKGLEAAQLDGRPLGVVDVLVARAGVLTAREHYSVAHRCLDEARELLTRDHDPEPALRRLARIDLRLGEGYLQMRSPIQAARALERARLSFEQLGAHDEARMARLLEGLNRDEPPELFPPVERTGFDGYRFWSLIARAEAQRRAREWDDAQQTLSEAAEHYSADARRTANVQYRLARLHLEHAMYLQAIGGAPARTRALLVRALRRATQALLAFVGMGNPVGEVRARLMLVRIMATAGENAAAEQQLYKASAQLERLDPKTVGDAEEPLRARQALADGYLRLSRMETDGARRMLIEASVAFRGLLDTGNDALAQELARVLPRFASERPQQRLQDAPVQSTD